MPRMLSLNARRAMTAERTGEVPVVLVTIEHPELPEPIRLSSDPTERLSSEPLIYGTRSRGAEYLFVAMSAPLPSETESAPPNAQIVCDNVDRRIVEMVRSVVSPPPTMTLEICLASDPDTVEEAYEDMVALVADYDVGQVTINLGVESFVSEPYPSVTFNPTRFPGLFR